MQQAVAARDAAIAANRASRPAPAKRPVGRPKVLAPLGVQAPPGREACVSTAATQVEWGRASGARASALHSKSSSSSSSRSPEAEEAGSLG